MKEYIIWCNNEYILRKRKSNILYSNGTFLHPKGYNQLLLIMNNDLVTN